jgi:ABC-type dipeptide/oligopeptide/nickel transport system permease subunit
VASTLAPIGPLEPTGAPDVVEARGYWNQIWRRFSRDRVALVAGVVIILLLLAAFLGAPIASHLLGHGPNDVNPINAVIDGRPVGPWSHVKELYGTHTQLYILGADGLTGRDEFLRLLYGAQVSFEVAVFSTLLGVLVGVTLGALAGYYGGLVDSVVSRLTELVMVFPFILFAIAVAATIGPRLNSYTFFGAFSQGVLTLCLIMALFSWFYPARIVRGMVLSLREQEFVEAARMLGASDLRIIRSHLLPHLVAPIIVWSSLIVAANVLAEAGLSYLAVGIPSPTASWGSLLSDASTFYLVQPWLMLWPGAAVLLMVLAFNLLGDGLRDAFDPRGTR